MTEEILIDVRVIAATNKDIEKEIEAANFREDLYYRLAVIPIHIPPLRERKSDTLTLVCHFIQKYNERLERQIQGISEEALAVLEAYHWPGNVRELENVIERAVTLETTDFIQKERLPETLSTGTSVRETGIPHFSMSEGLDLEAYLKRTERRIIEQGLEMVGGNQTKAAELLKLSYRSLRHRMKALGLRKKQSETKP